MTLIAPHHAAASKVKFVSKQKELLSAIKQAQPGDIISLAPGTYTIRRPLLFRRPGSADAPITFRAAKLGEVRINARTAEALKVEAPYWVFENLDIKGDCKKHSSCEHAFHVVGRASGTVIRNNRMHEFNAMIKLNGIWSKGRNKPWVFPHHVLIENNIFFNSTPRNTRNPVTPINLDGGQHLIVRGNLIADFGKTGRKKVSYGAFVKAMTRNAIFERNLVICELTHQGGIRIGLSFGGGGSPEKIREKPLGDAESLDGIMRNNIILNCPNDIGIYLNRAINSKIYNNTLYNTYGIDVRFPESNADIRNNIIVGGIRERDGGTAIAAHNLVLGTSLGNWIPGGTRYVTRRLEGQDEKYPNYIEKKHVEFLQSLVEKAAKMVAGTWVGNGSNSARSLFGNPDELDFSPRDADELIDTGQILPEIFDDFCGNRRSGIPDLGAIEYDGKDCDVRKMLRLDSKLPIQ